MCSVGLCSWFVRILGGFVWALGQLGLTERERIAQWVEREPAARSGDRSRGRRCVIY